MNEEFKFLFIEISEGKKVILNINQIVAVVSTSNGCYIKTTNSEYNVALKITIDEFYELLPSGIKTEEINL